MALLLALYLHLGSIGSGVGDQSDRGDENIVFEDGISLILQEDGASTLLTE